MKEYICLIILLQTSGIFANEEGKTAIQLTEETDAGEVKTGKCMLGRPRMHQRWKCHAPQG